MITAVSERELRHAVAKWRGRGERIGFVPTMGALHDGHLSLVGLARKHASRVVVSVFVNPTQFGPDEDLERYPRDLDGDSAKLAEAGCDLLFVPGVETIYPPGASTRVRVEGPARGLEADCRPGHFDGVATVVTALFGLVRPDVAVFGEKDAQQLAVVRALARDLHLGIEIVSGPIVRDEDGLAMSSRNAFLDADDRRAAAVLQRSLAVARAAIETGERDPRAVVARLADGVAAEPRARLDYAAVVAADTFHPVDQDRRRDRHPDRRSLRLDTPARQRPPAGGLKDGREEDAMRRTMMKSKIHRATVTDANLHYVGSVTVDPELMRAGDILENERVDVLDITNGNRLTTYAIPGAPGRGEICLNGAAAHLVARGDLVILVTYAELEEEEARRHVPRTVFVDEQNRILAGPVAQLAEQAVEVGR